MTEQATAERAGELALIHEYNHNQPERRCWVRFGAEPCERAVRFEVYGLPFCAEHGAEARDGALEELYQDASDFLARFDNSHVPEPNPAAMRVLRAGVSELTERTGAAELSAEETLREAYPTFGASEGFGEGDFVGYDHLRDIRHVLHKLMRLSFLGGESWLVEHLEPERERVAAQLSYLIRSGRDYT